MGSATKVARMDSDAMPALERRMQKAAVSVAAESNSRVG
jgi:hypothetical protein